MASNGNVEARAVIKFCVGLGKISTQTLKLIEESGTAQSSHLLVFKWLKGFKDGRERIYDDERCGKHATDGKPLPANVKGLIKASRRLTVRILAQTYGVSISTIHKY